MYQWIVQKHVHDIYLKINNRECFSYSTSYILKLNQICVKTCASKSDLRFVSHELFCFLNIYSVQ